VVVRGLRIFEGSLEKDLAGGGTEQVCSSNYFRDPHGGIIHSDSHLISGNIVASPNDEVAEIASGNKFLGSEMKIVKPDGFAIRNMEAPVHSGRIVDLEFLDMASPRIDGLIVGGVLQGFVRSLGRKRQIFP
jgi:hypothetical protein